MKKIITNKFLKLKNKFRSIYQKIIDSIKKINLNILIQFLTVLILIWTAQISYNNLKFQKELYEEDLYLEVNANYDIYNSKNKTYLLSHNLKYDTLHEVIYWPITFKISNLGLKPIKIISFESKLYCNGELIDSKKYWGRNMYSEGLLEVGKEFESDYSFHNIVFNEDKFELIKQPYICNVKFILKTSKKEYKHEINNFNYKMGLVTPEAFN